MAKIQTFHQSIQLSGDLIRARWLPLLGLLIINWILLLSFEGAVRDLYPEQEGFRIFLFLSMAIWDLTFGFLILLNLLWGAIEVHPLRGSAYNPSPLRQGYMLLLISESLRVLARVILWGLLLILPGLIRYVQLIFVPYIVMFSRDYEDDKVDALQLSRQLVKKKFWLILVIVVVTVAIDGVLEFLPYSFESLRSYPIRLALLAIGLLITVWTYSLMFLLFRRAMEE